jgi:hypothetical protein
MRAISICWKSIRDKEKRHEEEIIENDRMGRLGVGIGLRSNMTRGSVYQSLHSRPISHVPGPNWVSTVSQVLGQSWPRDVFARCGPGTGREILM